VIGSNVVTIRDWARLGTLLIVLAPGSVLAADWSLHPWVASRGQYQTNAALVSGDEIDGSSVQVQGGMDASRATERTELYFRPSVDVTRFVDDELEELDREAYFVDTGVTHLLRRSELELRLRFAQRPAYQSELDDALPDDPDDPLPAGGGDLTVRDDTQNSFEVQPRFSHELTERDTLTVNGRFLDVTYDEDVEDTNRFDYTDTRAGIEWARALRPRHTFVANIGGGKYSADSPDPGVRSDSDATRMTLGYRWQASEQDTLEVNAGAENTEFDARGTQFCTDPDEIAAGVLCDFRDDVTSFMGNVSWHRTGERYDLRTRLQSGVNPTSRGTQQERTEGRILLDRRFTERFTARLGVVASHQESLEDQTDYETDYASAEIGAQMRFSRTLSFTANYRYVDRKSQTNGNTTDDFDNHVVTIGLLWEAVGR
jgi:opacity protein-like surface antigen